MSDKYILDPNVGGGRVPVPIDDVLEWADWFGKGSHSVKRDVIGAMTVSTVFLALDHSWGSGPPLLFETMVFRDGGGEVEDYTRRSSTWDEAEADHKEVAGIIEWKQHRISGRTTRETK